MSDSIGKQVVTELVGIGKQTVQEATKAATDVLTGSIENLTSGAKTQVGDDNIAAMKQQKQMAAKKRYQQVLDELNTFRQKSKQKVKQEEQIEKQQEMEELQMKKSEKAKRDEEFIASVQRQYGGAKEGVKSGG